MRILFVCHGNICRSVMAEMILKDILSRHNINDVLVDSCATSTEEIGNSIYPPAYAKLVEKGISITDHKARQLTKADREFFDLIIGMDNLNMRNIIRIIGDDYLNKIHLFGEYMDIMKEVDDPWYTRDFETAYNDILNGCMNIYEKVI